MEAVDDTDGRADVQEAVAPLSADVIDTLRANLEDFGLNGYQARVLISLLRAGSGNATELAELTGIHRTSVYPVLKELRALGLSQQLSTRQGIWASPGRDVVISWLDAKQAERSKTLQARTEETRAALITHFRDGMAPSAPYLEILPTDTQAIRAYQRCLAEVTTEVLVFNRGPYVGTNGAPNPAVLEALSRGVDARALYREDEVRDPSLEKWHCEIVGLHRAGVSARVAEDVPMSLAVFDRKRVLFGLRPEPERPDQIDVLVDHPAYAATLALAFEQLWSAGRPFVPEEEFAADAFENRWTAVTQPDSPSEQGRGPAPSRGVGLVRGEQAAAATGLETLATSAAGGETQ